MAAHCKQIGQRTDHEEAMRVLLQTAIAHLGKAEHPLDDPDHMFNPGPHFGLGAVFRPLDLIDNTAVAVAAIGEIAGPGRALPDYRPLAAVSLITPYPGLLAVQQIGQHRTVGDIGRRRRGSLPVWFSAEAIAAWRAEPRTTRGGQPHYSALAITTALTLRVVFRLALRQTEGLIGSIIRLLGLDLAIPDHSTLSRRAETLEVALLPSSAEPVHLLVDSTGLKLSGAGEWLVEKHGTSRRRSWRKLHIGVDVDTGRIVAAALTTNDVDDGSQVGPLLDQIDDPIASLTGDGANDQD